MGEENGYWNRWLRRRLSRRSVLRSAAYGSAGLATAAVLGCGGRSTGGSQTDEEGEPRSGGTLVHPQTQSLNDVMDPHTSLYQAAILFSYIGNTALRLSQDATELVPELVESWEIPGDGTEIILKVRDGVAWHNKPPVNGRAFEAQDLAYNLMRIAAKLNPGQAARFQRRSDLEGMNRAEAVDRTTVRVVMDRPTSSFLAGMTDFRNQIIPYDLEEKGGSFQDPNGLIGTGPFMVESFQNGERAMFTRNPNYWRSGLPYLDSVEFVWLQDRLSHLSAFSQGQVDVFSNPTTAERETLQKTARNAREETWEHGQWGHFRFNTQRTPFNDPRVRRALQLVLKYDVINDSYWGEGYWDYTGPLTIAFPEAIPASEIGQMPGWNPDTKEQDIRTAKDLLSAAGYPDGALRFRVMPFSQSGAYYDAAIRAVDQWKQVWPAMQAEIDLPPDTATFGTRQAQGDFDVISYIIFAAPDAVLELSGHYHSRGGRNYGKFSDPKVDQLLDRAGTELDMDERARLLREVQEYLIKEQVPIITLYQPLFTAWFTNRVRGMRNFGGKLDGGSYDIWRHTEHAWIAEG